MSAAIAVGLLVAAGIYLLLQRGLVRIAIGFVLLGHAANILLVAAGGMELRGAPLLGSGDESAMADPLPQAFVLTAIVITFGITVFMLALARAGGDDDPDGQVDPDSPTDDHSPEEPDPHEPDPEQATAGEPSEASVGGQPVGLPAGGEPDGPDREAAR